METCIAVLLEKALLIAVDPKPLLIASISLRSREMAARGGLLEFKYLEFETSLGRTLAFGERNEPKKARSLRTEIKLGPLYIDYLCIGSRCMSIDYYYAKHESHSFAGPDLTNAISCCILRS